MRPATIAVIRRLVDRHRRLVVAMLAAATAATALAALRPPAPSTTRVLVAARDLRGGTSVRPRDTRTLAVPRALLPEGALRAGTPVSGRVLTAPARRGEILTDVRLLGPGLLAGYDGLVAAPVRIADAGAARLLRPGERVDVLAAPDQAGSDAAPALDAGDTGDAAAPMLDAEATVSGRRQGRVAQVISNAVVVAVPRVEPAAQEGALIVLGVTSPQATLLADAAARSRLSITIRATNAP